MKEKYYPFVNEPLPYDYSALEPFIDAETMHYHHDKHLQTYVDNLNAAVADSEELKKMSLEQLILNADELPEGKRSAVKNNAGGVYNHLFYFEELGKCEDCKPQGELAKAINTEFGGFEEFCAALKKTALGVFGSGYAWLLSDGGKLKLIGTANQNTPLTEGKPILCIDVWEHAYYLKNKNLRAAYIDNWFDAVNWSRAEALYLS